MNYDAICTLLKSVLAALQDESVAKELKFPTATIEIQHPSNPESRLVVELGACNRRESFSLAFRSVAGHVIFSVPYFGIRSLSDTFEDTTQVTGYRLEKIWYFLEQVEGLMEMIWMRCLELYFDNNLLNYKSRAASADPEVAAFYQFLGAKE